MHGFCNERLPHPVGNLMTPRDLWRTLLTLVFRAEFGPELAAELAALPLRDRREKVQAWDRARPSSAAILLVPDRWAVARFKLETLQAIVGEHGAGISPAAAGVLAQEIAELEPMVEAQGSDLPHAEQRLMKVEQVLAYASVDVRDFPRPLSIEGMNGLKKLQERAIAFATRQGRVRLLLEDFERFQGHVAEADRPNVEHWLARLRDLHAGYEAVIARMREVLVGEEEFIRHGYTADPHAFDRFEPEVANFDRQYAEMRQW